MFKTWIAVVNRLLEKMGLDSADMADASQWVDFYEYGISPVEAVERVREWHKAA